MARTSPGSALRAKTVDMLAKGDEGGVYEDT